MVLDNCVYVMFVTACFMGLAYQLTSVSVLYFSYGTYTDLAIVTPTTMDPPDMR